MSSVFPIMNVRQHYLKFQMLFRFLFSRSLSLFARIDVAVEMEARVYKRAVKKRPLNPSHGKSEEEMQIEERCKTPIPGRPDEGAVHREGGSGAAQKRPAGDNQKAPSLLKEIK
ncbi:hypothetical protein AMECASPLE_010585 [Ameca splendens]|uniref:Uncharacterized protein n=1 Tax=Ameca splendens TaxID=208324 RepID=A0ABV0YBJ7_9TELE